MNYFLTIGPIILGILAIIIEWKTKPKILNVIGLIVICIGIINLFYQWKQEQNNQKQKQDLNKRNIEQDKRIEKINWVLSESEATNKKFNEINQINDYEKTIELFKTIDVSSLSFENKLVTYFKMAWNYQQISGHENEAKEFYYKVLELLNEHKEKISIQLTGKPDVNIVFAGMKFIEDYDYFFAYSNYFLGRLEVDNNPSKALEYFNLSEPLLNKYKEYSFLENLIEEKANLYVYLGDLNKADLYYEQCLDKAIKSKDSIFIARTYHNIGNYNILQGRYSKAEEYLKQSIDVSKKKQLIEQYNRSILDLGICYAKQKNNDEGEKLLINASEYFNSNDFPKELAFCYANLGHIQFTRKKFKIALEYFKKALTIYDSINFSMGIANEKANIGNVYMQFKKWRKSKKYIQSSLNIHKQNGYKLGEATSYKLLGALHANMGRKKLAKEYIQQSIDIYTELNNVSEANKLKDVLLKIK